MATITAAMVKELRETTGAGMMDCKAALTESDGNMEAAIDWLRKKGLSKAAKKAGRVAAEGLVGIGRIDALSKGHVLYDNIASIAHGHAFSINRDAAGCGLTGHREVVGEYELRIDVDRTADFEHDRAVGLTDGVAQ